MRYLEDEKQFGKCDVQVGPGQAVQDRNCFCWVMHRWPNAARIHYGLLLLPAREGEEGVRDDEGAGQLDRCSLSPRDDV